MHLFAQLVRSEEPAHVVDVGGHGIERVLVHGDKPGFQPFGVGREGALFEVTPGALLTDHGRLDLFGRVLPQVDEIVLDELRHVLFAAALLHHSFDARAVVQRDLADRVGGGAHRATQAHSTTLAAGFYRVDQGALLCFRGVAHGALVLGEFSRRTRCVQFVPADDRALQIGVDLCVSAVAHRVAQRPGAAQDRRDGLPRRGHLRSGRRAGLPVTF